MTESVMPPFTAAEPDRLELWRMLVPRDIDAYLAHDWDAVAGDFVEDGFFGLDARHRHDPGEWRLTFPNLGSYREEWLRQAAETQRTADIARARAALLEASRLTEINLTGDGAVAHKKFNGTLPNRDGSHTRLNWQTLYICRRVAGRWKIASFVGYLPYDAPSIGGSSEKALLK